MFYWLQVEVKININSQLKSAAETGRQNRAIIRHWIEFDDGDDVGYETVKKNLHFVNWD